MAIVTIVSALIGYCAMFSHMSYYDDEGYLLITIRQLLTHGGLYERMYTPYGPFYYAVVAGIFRLPGVPVSHDAGRLLTLGNWIVSSLLVGVAAMRLSRSRLIGVCAQILGFFVLRAFVAEPLHPAHLTTLLLIAAVTVTAFLIDSRPTVTMAVLGAVVAATLLVKINIGIFAGASLVLSLALTRPLFHGRAFLKSLTSIAFVLVPGLLMIGHLQDPSTLVYCLAVTGGAAALVMVLRGVQPDRELKGSDLVALTAGGGAVVLLSTLFSAGAGSNLAGVITNVVLVPLTWPGLTGGPLLGAEAGVTTVICVMGLAAASIYLAWPRVPRFLGRHPFADATIRGAAGLLIWSAAVLPRSSFLFGITLIWVAAIPPGGGAARISPFVRVLTCSLAVLQGLHAFPVAGSQVAFSGFMLLPVGAICLGDALGELAMHVEPSRQRARSLTAAAMGSIPLVCSTALAIAIVGIPSVAAYTSSVPLQGDGASLIRLPADQSRTYNSVEEVLRARCSTYFAMPGIPSFYLFVDEPPPTDFNAEAWMYLLDDDQQRTIIGQLAKTRGLCVIKNQALIDFWGRGSAIPDGPLVVYLRDNFKEVDDIGGYELWTRPA